MGILSQIDQITGADAAPALPDNEGDFSKGLRSGMTTMGGQLRALAGAVGETLGADQFAADQYAKSAQAQQLAAEQAPSVRSYKDVTDLRSGLKYGAGLIGQSLPFTASGLAAAGATALTGGGALPVLAASTLATAPFMAGETVQTQQADPDVLRNHSAGTRLATAVGTGLGSALLENAVPLAMAGKVAKGAATAAKPLSRALLNVPEAVLGEGATEGAQELLQQGAHTALNANRDKSGDTDALLESAIGGAVAGAPFGAAGVAGDMRGAKAAAQPKAEGPSLMEQMRGVLDSVKAKAGKKEAPVSMTDVLKPESITGDDHALELGLATARPEQHEELFSKADDAATQKALAKADKLREEALTEEDAAALDKFDLKTPEGQQAVHDMRLKYMQRGKATQEVDELTEYLASLDSYDTDALRSDAKATPQSFYGLFEHPEFDYLQNDTKQKLADGMPSLIAAMESGKGIKKAMTAVNELLGDKARSILTQAYNEVGSKDAKKRDNFFKHVSKLIDDQKSEGSLLATVREALPEHMIDRVKTSQVKDFVQQMKDFVSEKGMDKMSVNERKVFKAGKEDELQALFGDKYDQVNEAFAGWAKAAQGDVRAEKETGEDSMLTEQTIEGAAEPSRFYGKGKDKEKPEFIEHMDVHRAKYGEGESAHERLLRRAQYENPDRSVSWMSAKDYAREHNIDEATLNQMTDGRPQEHGLIVAEGAADEGRITWKDLDGMQLGRLKDGKREFSADYDSPSRIDTEAAGVILDAQRIARVMNKKLGYADGEFSGSLHRLRRAFEEGIAAVSDHLGEAIHVDDHIVVAKRNGKDVTYGELKKLPKEEAPETFDRSDTPTAALQRRLDKTQLKMDGIEQRMQPLSEKEKSGQELTPREQNQLSKAREEWMFERRKERALVDAVNAREDSERANQIREGFGLKDYEAEQDYTSAYKHLKEETPRGVVNEKAAGTARISPDNVHVDSLLNPDTAVKFDEAGQPLQYATKKAEGPHVAADNMQAKIDMLKAKATTAAGKSVVAKAQSLFDHYDALTSTHQKSLAQALNAKKLSDAVVAINALADQYAETLKAPGKSPVAKRESFAKMLASGEFDLDRIGKITDAKALQAGLIPLLRQKNPDANTKGAINAINERISALLAEDVTGQAALTLQTQHEAPTDYVALEQRASAALAYLNEPDSRYTSQKAKDAAAWAQRWLDRTEGNEEPDVDTMRGAMKQIVKKAKTMLEGDEVFESKGATGTGRLTPNDMQDIEATLTRMLGNSVDLQFDNMGHAGDYTPASATVRGLLRISVHALDGKGTAYHEALHALFDQLRTSGAHDITRVLERAAKGTEVLNVLRERFKGQPSVLKQIEDSYEERAAYMFQLFASGDRDMHAALSGQPKNVFVRLLNALKATLGVWTNDRRAVAIMEHFQRGDFASTGTLGVRLATMEQGRNETLDHVNDALTPLKDLATAFLTVGSARIRGFENPALTKIVDLTRRSTFDEGGDPGYMNARRVESYERKNRLMRQLMQDVPEASNADYDAVMTAMRHEKDDPQAVTRLPAAQRRIASIFRDSLDETFNYMHDAGVAIKDYGFGKDYAPRMWDVAHIASNEPQFRAMLEKYVRLGSLDPASVDGIIDKLMGNDGGDLIVDPNMPANRFAKERVLKMISAADAEPFMEKDGLRTMALYIDQATRRAEWTRRYGDENEVLDKMLAQAKDKYGASEAELETTRKYLAGLNGTLGDDLSPTARKWIANAMIYQNVRLLPLGIFSAVIDANGIMVNGGTVKESFGAFIRGVKEIRKNFQSKPDSDDATKFAEDMGVIESAVLHHALGGTTFGLTHASPAMRRANDLLFRFNGMEQWNTSMRVSAAQAAVNFIGRHADGRHNQHSLRYLAELGLRPSDIVKGSDGRPLFKKDDLMASGMSEEAATKRAALMAMALNRWVDGAVLRPDATQKPIWMNDPHFQLFGHMKQFMFAFQETTLKRVAHEFKHHNYGPLLALSSYVPVMLAADVVKGLIQGFGDQPDWKDKWGADDYFAASLQRAGLFGVGQLGIDVVKNMHHGGLGVGALGGPTIGQMGDVLLALGGAKSFQNTVVDALPANTLWGNWFEGSADSGGATELNSID